MPRPRRSDEGLAKRITVYVSPPNAAWLAETAQKQRRSLGAVIDRVLDAHRLGPIAVETVAAHVADVIAETRTGRDTARRRHKMVPPPVVTTRGHDFTLLVGGGVKVCQHCRHAPASAVGRNPACPGPT